MRHYFHQISSRFRSGRPVPAEFRNIFNYLYLDMVFWGVLNGTTLVFLAVYAARIGASGAQIGLIGAIPAFVNLLVTFPAGSWLEGKPIHQTIPFTAVVTRLFYLLLAPLPFIFPLESQINAILLVTLVMSIPGTAMAVGFQALFAKAVPQDWRAHVAGVRNALFSITVTISAMVSGAVLESISFPLGYQIVFFIGFIGAMLSSWMLLKIRSDMNRPLAGKTDPEQSTQILNGLIERPGLRSLLRFDILRTPYARIVALLFIFHFTQYLPMPVFPLFTVQTMHFSDQVIGLGNAFFYIAVSVGSTQLERITSRIRSRGAVAYGAIILAVYPGLLSITHDAGLYLFTNVIGGLAWSLIGGAIYNYLLENIPTHDRPGHLAWYNLVFNGGILCGSIIGPVIAGQLGIPEALAFIALLRFISGFAILKWG